MVNFIPNEATATYAVQAEPDSVDFDIMLAGLQASGVITGCAVSPQGTPDMTVAVASGTLRYGGVLYTTAGSSALTHTAADPLLGRFDLVVATTGTNNLATVSVVTGTAANPAVFPAIPANSVVLAAVYLQPGAGFVQTANIVDKRVFIFDQQFMRSAFGDGSDGDVVFDGVSTPPGSTMSGLVYTLTRDVYYNSMHVPNAVTVKANGYRIYVRNIATIDAGGVISNNGANGNPGTAGTAGAQVSGTNAGTVGASGFGGAGGNAAAGSNGGNAGSGGSGGTGGGFTGDAGGSAGNLSPTTKPHVMTTILTYADSGGTGGGGGGTNSGGTGSGGAGGGTVALYAYILVHNGDLQAKGGNGGDGYSSTGNGTGGGGGGGGFILVVYGSLSGAGTFTVTGGNPGNTYNNGTLVTANGGSFTIAIAGATGTVLKYQV